MPDLVVDRWPPLGKTGRITTRMTSGVLIAFLLNLDQFFTPSDRAARSSSTTSPRQLLSLARASLVDPAILLLDGDHE
jgi:hypothetical protein